MNVCRIDTKMNSGLSIICTPAKPKALRGNFFAVFLGFLNKIILLCGKCLTNS